ncbi:MAG: prepilin peptidase, partial [Microcoleus sp.]
MGDVYSISRSRPDRSSQSIAHHSRSLIAVDRSYLSNFTSLLMEIIFNSLVYAIVFALGSAIGSFLNVVVYRLPAGLSVLSPPSRCPKCLNRLRFYENVPVFGWLWLRGRCNHCRS